ncbi:MAG TPA: DUF5777 family beta-barrel protein [Chryseosolibacter sp.]|nr:DUF5777 family beta-barrel protein [Chryseosolibacter sp.]
MKIYLLCLLLILNSILLVAQEDLLREVEASQPEQTQYALQTFKGTRLINGHSLETKAKGDFEFIFAHRFGPINSGIFEFFGWDEAYVRLGLDYGLTDNLSASIGRNSVDKTVDGYIKYKLLRQQKGASNFPLTITTLGGVAYKASPRKNEVPEGFKRIDRLAYVAQALIGRKFNSNLSFQVMPTFVHKNSVDQSLENNDQFALGFGGRLKITKSFAVTSEYYYRTRVNERNPSFNSLGFGAEIETGGHVFQLLLTNSRGLTERAFITETEGDFADGDIHFGFNVTRTFHVKGKKSP